MVIAGWQPPGEGCEKTRDVLIRYRGAGVMKSAHMTMDEMLRLERRIKDVRFFDSLCPTNRIGHGEALAVIWFR